MTDEEGRKEAILTGLANAVDAMDEEASARLAREALDAGIDAYEAITQGCSKGMAVVSDKYDNGIYFVPEILLCADAMYAAVDILKPHLKTETGSGRTPIIIGVIQGDIHDIGKNIVKLMLEAAAYPVHDLGNDVSVAAFVDKAREVGSGIIAVSTLMSTTMKGMGALIEALTEAGIRDSFRVMIGGGPISSAFAQKIGADGYGANAAEAIQLANDWQEVAK